MAYRNDLQIVPLRGNVDTRLRKADGAELDAVVLAAAGLARLGYLDLPWVMVVGFCGTLFIDQFLFYLGRRHSARLNAFMSKRPLWRSRANRVRQLVERYRTPLILSFRFLYGLRTVAPLVMGTSRIPVRTFFLLNFISALVWAMALGAAGYLFGQILMALLGNIKRFEREIMALIVIGGGLIWLIYFHRSRSRRKRHR